MKKIHLPITQTYSTPLDIGSLDIRHGRASISIESFIKEEFVSAVEAARANGGSILYATTSIEQKLESILLEFFMGSFLGHDEKRALFEREVLQSTALSFGAKKSLIIKIVNSDSAILHGKNKNFLQDDLAKISEWRNAFAHGKVQHDAKKGCFITYYSGQSKTLLLTDDYWDSVERVFRRCDGLIDEVSKKIRLPRADAAPP